MKEELHILNAKDFGKWESESEFFLVVRSDHCNFKRKPPQKIFIDILESKNIMPTINWRSNLCQIKIESKPNN